MMKNRVQEIFEECEAFFNGHFILTSGRHSGEYLQKALVITNPEYVSDLCYDMAAEASRIKGIEVVVGPAPIGVGLAISTAYHLGEFYGDSVLSLFTEKINGIQVLGRGYQKLVAGKNVLVVDDISTTGGSIKQIIEEVRKAGGKVVAVCVLCNRCDRGALTSKDFGCPFFPLWEIKIESWTAEECPLCREGVPVTNIK